MTRSLLFNHRVIKILSLGAFALFLLSSEVEIVAQEVLTSEETMQAFYTTLHSNVDDSLMVQISELKKFVTRFPGFEPGYQWLLEKYNLNEQNQQAKHFFMGLAGKNAYSRNANWMLAKIYTQEGNSNDALKAYSAALNTGRPMKKCLAC